MRTGTAPTVSGGTTLAPPPTRTPYPPPRPAGAQFSPQIGTLQGALGGLETQAKQIQTGLQNRAQVESTENRFGASEKAITGLLAPSAEEEGLRTKLSNLMASRDLGLIEAEKQPIPLQAILGEQSRIERRAGVQAGTLQEQLAQSQARRQASIDAAKTEYGFEKERYERAKPDEDKVDEYTNAEGKRVVVFRDKKTGKVREEVLGKTVPAKATQSEQARALTTGAIAKARPILVAARGQGGYVDPNTYLKLRSDYAEAIGSPSVFDATFGPMLSPAERQRLGVGRVISTAEDIGSVLAGYLGQ